MMVAERLSALLVSRDELLLRLARSGLEEAGFEMRAAERSGPPRAGSSAGNPNVVLLDLEVGLPETLKALGRWAELPQAARPLLIVVARSAPTGEETLQIFKAGADDLISKPVQPQVLAARIQALLKAAGPRKGPAGKAGLLKTRDGQFVMDLAAHRCYLAAQNADSGEPHLGTGHDPLPDALLRRRVLDPSQYSEVRLARREFALTAYLLSRKNELATRAEIIKNVWRSGDVSEKSHSLLQHITNLRKKLGHFAQRIENVWGEGYRVTD